MNWDVICSVLDEFGIVCAHREHFECGSRLFLLDESASDQNETIYVTQGGVLPRYFRRALIVSTGPCSGQADNLIQVEGGNLCQVFNLLAKTKGWLDRLDGTLALCDTYQEIIDCTSNHMGLPMFYLDESYRVLAITKGVPSEQDPEWRHMTEKGFLSPESTRHMKENGDLDMLAAARRPVIYRNNLYPFTSIVCNIYQDDRFVGRLNILSVNGNLSPTMLRAGEIAASHLGRILGRSGKLSTDSPLRDMLIDLLHGIRLSEEFINERLRATPYLIGTLLQVFSVDVEAQDDRQIVSYYASLLQRVFPEEPIIPLIFEDHLILLVYADTDQGFNSLTVRLAHFFTAHHLRCGVSNRFRRLSALRGYFGQAEAALAAEPGEGLHFYQGIMLDHLISYLPPDRTEFLISPDIARLEDAEGQYSFSLVDTLREYLACNCNLIKTSKRLFIHKNTLLYRMNHIRSMIQCDLDDADDRLLLMLSFKLLGRQKTNDSSTV